ADAVVVPQCARCVDAPLSSCGVHGVYKCLVVVSQMYGSPAWGLGNDVIGPGTIRQIYFDLFFKWHVFTEVHTRWLLKFAQSFSSIFDCLVLLLSVVDRS